MDRLLSASVLGLGLGLGLGACGPSATRGPSTQAIVTTASSDDAVCTDERSPSGMTRRVCRSPVSASAAIGNARVRCADETPTVTQLARRSCPPGPENAIDRHFIQAANLAPMVRLRVETGGAGYNPKNTLIPH